MDQPNLPDFKDILLAEVYRPAIITWNRLEGRPTTEDFDRSLQVEVRDPLWMLCRQWQFGEFRGEDAGSAVKAQTQVTSARINRYAGRSRMAVGYEDNVPLETVVEREALLKPYSPEEPDPYNLMLRAQMGKHWFKLIPPNAELRAAYLDRFGFIEPKAKSEQESHLRSDPLAAQTFTLLKGRVVDGKRLLTAIRSEPDEHATWVATLGGDPSDLLQAAKEFVLWYERVYSTPGELDDPSWHDAFQEYQFAASAPADLSGDQQTVLFAEQYHHGHLDWYSFDLDSAADAALSDKPEAEIPDEKLQPGEPISFIPNPIEFGGMPNVRWWEFEDSKTDFGNINPGTTDLATLMLAEFALIYGNDWSLIPYVVDVGTLSEVLNVVVTDVFGVRILIRPALNTFGDEHMRWGMYYLNHVQGERIDTRLLVPPTVSRLLESQPIEQVILTRDEMANMVWGIEAVVPGVTDGGMDGYEAATALSRYLVPDSEGTQEQDEIKTEAEIQYRLGTTVAENWIPIIPVHLPGSNQDIRLQRAAMPRMVPGFENQVVEPRGTLLRPGLDQDPKERYFFHENGVQKAGTIIQRTYQRVRWWNGRIYTWLGRRKLIGRGQGSSGLEFDRIVPK
jgi:hypothetical protein